MLMYKQEGNDRWDNAYQWTTDEMSEFLSVFPEGTPIHSDLYIHSSFGQNPQRWKKYTSRDGKYIMNIPQDVLPILYIQEGTMPVGFEDMFDGKAKNLIKKAYDIVGLKKFLAMVFDVVSEGYEDDDGIIR